LLLSRLFGSGLYTDVRGSALCAAAKNVDADAR